MQDFGVYKDGTKSGHFAVDIARQHMSKGCSNTQSGLIKTSMWHTWSPGDVGWRYYAIKLLCMIGTPIS